VTTKPFAGSCACGAISYEAAADPAFTGQCHCLDCQKTSGAGHVAWAGFPRSAVKIVGTYRIYKSKADSGAAVERYFCPECGSLIASVADSMPDAITLTLATMDEAPDIEVALRLYDKRRRRWDAVDPAQPAFAEMPPEKGPGM
jgi:hypothetical protein